MRRHPQPKASHSYFVTMIDYGQRGQEAIVDPEITRRGVAARIATLEYDPERIVFIHHVDGLYVEDVTDELLSEARTMEAA